MAEYPYFPFYAEDFAAGTAAMSPLEVGIYTRCLCHQWSHGFVPNDQTKVARITGALPAEVVEAWPAVAQKFQETTPGQLQNERLEVERAKMFETVERRSEAGKAGARARWAGDKRNAVALANASPSHCGRNGKPHGKTMPRAFDSDSAFDSDLESEFEAFWKAFPRGRKKSMAKARTAFAKAIAKKPAAEILAAVVEYAASDEGRGAFVKMPETWLNGECWADDRDAWKSKSSASSDPRGTLAAADQYLNGATHGR